MTSPLLPHQNVPLRILQGKDRAIYYSHAAEELELSLNPYFPAKDSSTNIVSLINNHTTEGGTGILLNKHGFVLTSFHLVDQFKQNNSSISHHHICDSFYQSHPIDPSFFAYDPLHDLALIRALGISPSTPTIPISNTPLTISQIIYYIAFVDGINITQHLGQIRSTSHDVHHPHKSILNAIAFSGEGQRGFSGAPLFNNQNHLVGNPFGGGYLDDEFNDNDENELNNSDEELNFGTKAIYIIQLIEDVIYNLNHTK